MLLTDGPFKLGQNQRKWLQILRLQSEIGKILANDKRILCM
jgi:hypothetical protein